MTARGDGRAPGARVIGIGREAAGDDGVGPAVVRALLAAGVPPGVDVRYAGEPTALIPLLETAGPVILVDAVVGAEPGDVLDLAPDDLARHGLTPLSTHGVGVVQAIALARTLSPDAVSPRIRIVGVGIAPPAPSYHPALSPPVAAAVPRAAQAILRLLEE